MLPLSKRRALERLIAGFDARRGMITSDGWFDWAERDPGPVAKTNGGRNTVRGFVPHSAEGYWPYLQTLLHSMAREASWGASNLKNGRLVQHYSIFAQTWTSGAGYPNNNFFSNETEGVAGEPLTDGQVNNIVRQVRELSALKLWTPRRPTSPTDTTATLYEHTDCVRWGAKYTACPSGRIPWPRIMAALQPQEDDMKPFLAWCAEEGKVYFIGPGGAKWIPGSGGGAGPVFAELERVFGKMTVGLSSAAIKAIGAA